MQSLKVEFENCYGIEKLNKEFNFTIENNVNVIYAKNGLMKTSFAKIFKKFQKGKEGDIKDIIFNKTPIVKNIKVDNIDINKDEIFVINSFEKAYESGSISSLLINEDIRTRLVEIIRIKNSIFTNLKDKSGLDSNKGLSTKGFLKLEEQILKDFNFAEQSFLQNIASLSLDVDYDYSDIEYSQVFHKAVFNNIIKTDFQTSIRDYLEKSDEIYEDYTFFEKGNLNLPKLKNIKKELETSSFFVKTNKIYLDGSGEFANLQALVDKIEEIELRLQETTAFKAIDKALSTIDGKFLKDIIENNPAIIEELALNNLTNFRRKLWLSYLKLDEIDFNTLKENYLMLIEEIRALDINTTLWKKSLKIFNDRFSLPFSMDIDNPISSITGESLPKIIFDFGNGVLINRDELENNDTLSQGEKRALYLLNIIFDVEKRKNENEKTLFIIDDIADSFDYKNKYAIIEYLREISKFPNFYMIILSHNFDFYRIISNRLNLSRQNKLHASKNANEVNINPEHYQNNPFSTWKNVLKARIYNHYTYTSTDAIKHILSLIPFVRNLIEYGKDKHVNNYTVSMGDYLLLTNLLHIKDETKNIKFNQLKTIYGEYIDNDSFDSSIDLNNDSVYDSIINIADNNILDENILLENKIILAIAIRLISEEFMKSKIEISHHIFTWKNRNRTINTGNKDVFLTFIDSCTNQTWELFNGYRQIGSNDNIQKLDSVNIMTPENIHLNSFMYEPLLDMDIIELKQLYTEVKGLI
ncbi:ATP-binding protein [Aliarcobacter butzleri]|uniref:Protein CR006 P-loop domain-containing protein n=1 Tax=Aliarcobacter butzleri TaxID=28197 RepID=A0AAW6VHT9_9BACT|nr:hypothetical protein [Aliarcobacter butzleri]MDK2041305.1 hypothetical protein [Aliarcobacter butzleri]MDK2096270.1 hypothetical protein [Aliarcobacter butzleri]